ncbi:MAG: hypothetical protein ABIC19_01540 [Patescibacteria group bacterium]
MKVKYSTELLIGTIFILLLFVAVEVTIILASTKISNHWLLMVLGMLFLAIIVIALLFIRHNVQEIKKEKLNELFGTRGGRGCQFYVDKTLKKLALEFNRLDVEERETGIKPKGLEKAKRAFWRAHRLARQVNHFVSTRPKYTDYLN